MRVDCRKCSAYISHSDRLAEAGRLCARGNKTDLCASFVLYLVTMAGNTAIDHLETNQFPLNALRLLIVDNLFGGEILVELGDPAKSRLQWSGVIVYIVSIKTIAHFKP